MVRFTSFPGSEVMWPGLSWAEKVICPFFGQAFLGQFAQNVASIFSATRTDG